MFHLVYERKQFEVDWHTCC